jgi:hypothetical protein
MTEVREQAAEQARRATGKAREQMRAQVDQRSTQAGERVSMQAADIRSVGEQLRNQGKDGPARIADQVAERTERVGAWLTESDADRILGDVEDFGRRNPWALAAGGAAVGFMASRLLKASSRRRYEQQHGQAGHGQLEPRFERPVAPMPGEMTP